MDSNQSSTTEFKRKKLAGRTKLAMTLIIAPTLLIVVSLTLFALINLIFNPTFWPTPDTEALTNTPIGITLTNGFFFVLGAAGVIAWLPGLIIGAYLLIRRPKDKFKA